MRMTVLAKSRRNSPNPTNQMVINFHICQSHEIYGLSPAELGTKEFT
jgi:hypothetical protein